MPYPTDRITARPELYSDIIAAGGLAVALSRVAADLGLEIGVVEPRRPSSPADARIASPRPGTAHLTVTAITMRRLFRVENNKTGIDCARGYTSELSEIVKAAAAWHSGADPRGMKAAADFIELPLLAEARAAGSAESIVELRWRQKRESWAVGHRRYKPDTWREPTLFTGLRSLLDAVMDVPELRCLYGVTSHFNLWFSACTEIPLAPVGAIIVPQPDGGYRVLPRLGHHQSGDGEYFDTPQAALARAADLLPENTGAAIFGTAADLAT